MDDKYIAFLRRAQPKNQEVKIANAELKTRKSFKSSFVVDIQSKRVISMVSVEKRINKAM
jgi:hypothetical protein